MQEFDVNRYVADRARAEGQDVWSEFIALAKKTCVANFGQSYPDFPPPTSVTQALSDAALSSDYAVNQYARDFGHPRLVKILAKIYSLFFNRNLDPMLEILITAGAYNALNYGIFAFIQQGDEVIIIEPFFRCYESMVRMAGGVCKFVTMELHHAARGKSSLSSADFQLDFNKLESLVTPRTKMILFSNPNNPIGKVFTFDELNKLAEIAKRHNLLVVSDEVYEHLTFDGNEHKRIASLPGMWERTITICSAGKMMGVTGWKVGWVIAPRAILRHLCVVHHNCIFTICTVVQEALAMCLEQEFKKLDSHEESVLFILVRKQLAPKRDRMVELVKQMGLTPIVPEGGYFVLAETSNMEGPFNIATNETRDIRLAKWLAVEKKIGAIPPSAFYCEEHKRCGENLIRFCFAKSDETFEKAEEVVANWIQHKDEINNAVSAAKQQSTTRPTVYSLGAKTVPTGLLLPEIKDHCTATRQP